MAGFPAQPAVTSPAVDGGFRRLPGRIRLRLDLAYDGTDYSGWASQPGLRTVQGTVEDALARVLRIEAAPTTCAGRTDAGVHARGQVVHVDVPLEAWRIMAARDRRPAEEGLRDRMLGVLPPDVRLRRVAVAAPGFDARFSALWRRYAYRVCDDPAALDPLRRREVLVHSRRLELEPMNVAARRLVGEHDFAAYCRRREGATTVRALREFSWARVDGLAVATVVADAFCHSMVRALVGALLAVGGGRRAVDWPRAVLDGGRRDSAVNVVGPRGLTLEEVGYPDDSGLAARAEQARRPREAGVPPKERG